MTREWLLGLPHPKSIVRIVILLIFLSALPDALVVPVLKDLFADRYGVSTAQAQLFLAVNLLGALLAIPLVKYMRRRMSGWAVVSSTAIVDGILMSLATVDNCYNCGTVIKKDKVLYIEQSNNQFTSIVRKG